MKTAPLTAIYGDKLSTSILNVAFQGPCGEDQARAIGREGRATG